MGWNATVVILVDQLQSIERDPDFGKKLADAVRHKLNDPNGRYGREPYVTGQTRVVEAHHADHMVAVAVGGNTAHVLGFAGGYAADPDDLIKNLNQSRLMRKRLAKETASLPSNEGNGHG